MSLNETWLKRVGHAEEKEKIEANRSKGHSALSEEMKQERAIRPLWEKHKWELQGVQSEEIVRNTVRVWESKKEKKKSRYFSFLKLHKKKINWWRSHEVFECYNHGEL